MQNAGSLTEAGILIFTSIPYAQGRIGLERDGNAVKLHELASAKLSGLAKLNLSVDTHYPISNHRLGLSTGIGRADRFEKRVKRNKLALDLKFMIHSFTFLT